MRTGGEAKDIINKWAICIPAATAATPLAGWCSTTGGIATDPSTEPLKAPLGFLEMRRRLGSKRHLRVHVSFGGLGVGGRSSENDNHQGAYILPRQQVSQSLGAYPLVRHTIILPLRESVLYGVTSADVTMASVVQQAGPRLE
jgi:hypothetical protein